MKLQAQLRPVKGVIDGRFSLNWRLCVHSQLVESYSENVFKLDSWALVREGLWVALKHCS